MKLSALLLLLLSTLCCAQDEHARVIYAGESAINVHANRVEAVPLTFSILPGFHINSHQPRSRELIATNLVAVETAGITVAKVDFPPGEDYAFSFDPDQKLSVYTGQVTLKAYIRADSGTQTLHAMLHYQACDNRTCFPPKDVPVTVTLQAK